MKPAPAGAGKNIKGAAAARPQARQPIDRVVERRRLEAALRESRRELSFFVNAAKALTSTLEFKQVLQVIVEKAQRLVAPDAWALLLLDSATKEFYIERAEGLPAGLKGARFPFGHETVGRSARNGTALLLNDLNPSKSSHLFRPARALLSVPIRNKKETIGVLEMFSRSPGAFLPRHREILEALVEQAAIAIDRSHLYQQMADLASTDDLTQLFNFRYLDQTLDIELRRSQKYGSTVSLIFLDMDYFKKVNDRYGHLAGSKVLIEVAQLLIGSLRDVDIIARYGGDEFVVVLPETNAETTVKITQRVQRSIQNRTFLEKEGLSLHLTASFGIATFPDHAKTKRDLLRLADEAMYRAKESGRDRISLAET